MPKTKKPGFKKPFNKKGGKPFAPKKCESTPEQDVREVVNDWKWYAQNEQLLVDSASLAYSDMLGNRFSLYSRDLTSDTIGMNYFPGIVEVELIPTIGLGKTATDAATVAARNIYTFVRHANSGSSNYEAPDLMMYIIAHAQATAWINDMKRAYGVMRHYTVRNRYYAETLISAMGYDFDDLLVHLADFRQLINISAARLNALKVPKGMPLVERWNWLSSEYFVDTVGAKAQTYVPKLIQHFKFDATGSQTGSQLVKVLKPAKATLEQARTHTEELLNPLLSDEDIGIMSGDIMKAYKENVSEISNIDENYFVLPGYSEEVLSQFHNAWNGSVRYSSINDHTITQTASGVIQESLTFNVASPSDIIVQKDWKRNGKDRVMLDMYKDTVTPADTMVATRLVCFASEATNSGVITAESCGSEFLFGFEVWTAPDKVLNSPLGNTRPMSNLVYDGREIVAISAFEWHPRIIYYVVDLVNEDAVAKGVVGNIENYTVADKDTIDKMHKVAILSEVAVTTNTTV